MGHATQGNGRKRSDRWAVRALWLVLLASAGFGVWSYAEGGLPFAVTFGGAELIFCGWQFMLIAVIFVTLLLALSAWPGKRALWLGVAVMTVFTSIPASVVTAIHLAQGFPHASPVITWLSDYLLMHNWPELVAYDLAVLAVSAWVALLYFPRLRGWRLAVYWTATVVVFTMFEFLFPVQ